MWEYSQKVNHKKSLTLTSHTLHFTPDLNLRLFTSLYSTIWILVPDLLGKFELQLDGVESWLGC